jgi:hypothetical protein
MRAAGFARGFGCARRECEVVNGSALRMCTFYVRHPGAPGVHLVGTLRRGGETASVRFCPVGADGLWRATVALRPGVYRLRCKADDAASAAAPAAVEGASQGDVILTVPATATAGAPPRSRTAPAESFPAWQMSHPQAAARGDCGLASTTGSSDSERDSHANQ